MVTCSDLPSRKDPWSCWCSDADGIFWESSPLSWHKKATNTTVLLWASVKIASGPCQSIFSVLTLLEHVGSVSQDSRSAPPGHWESLQRHMLARQARPLCYHVSYSWTSWFSEALRCKTDVKHLQKSQNLQITLSVHQWAAIWESIIYGICRVVLGQHEDTVQRPMCRRRHVWLKTLEISQRNAPAPDSSDLSAANAMSPKIIRTEWQWKP